MRLDVKEELAGSIGSNGDGMHACIGRQAETADGIESDDAESFQRGTVHNRVDESDVRLSELRGARRRD